MSDEVLQVLDGAVLTLTLNRPAKKNAFNNAAWLAFAAALNEARENTRVACVVLCGAGDDFSSGVDLGEFGREPGEEQPFHVAERALIQFDKPLIAAARGVAVGGGATILFHADLVYVGESLRMRLPFVNLGLVPELASSYMLQRNIGAQQAAELFYTAEWIDADRALEKGIALAKFADHELIVNAQEKAREIAQWPVRSLQETKRCLKRANEAGISQALLMEHAGMEKMAGSPENIEAISAFLEKRKADFSSF